MIEPTIGRKVWFWPNGSGYRLERFSDKQACDATIVYVWGPRMVNLRVTDHNGDTLAISSVDLLQDDDAKPNPPQSFATWIPYQVGQAKKHEADKV